MSNKDKEEKKMFFIANWKNHSVMPQKPFAFTGTKEEAETEIKSLNKKENLNWGFMTTAMFEFFPLKDLMQIFKIIADAEKEGITNFNGAKGHIMWGLENHLKRLKEHEPFHKIW